MAETRKPFNSHLNLEEYERIRKITDGVPDEELDEKALAIKNKIKTHNDNYLKYDPFEYKFPERWSESYSDTQLDNLLVHAAGIGANDIFFETGKPVRAKINGFIYKLTADNEILSGSMMAQIANKICSEIYQSIFTKAQACNTKYLIKRDNGDGTMYTKAFRVNNHQVSDNGMDITLRVINDYPFTDKTISKDIKDVFRNKNGIILIVGATGTGKSSFLASLIMDKIQDPNCSQRILTLEAPIEFDFKKIIQNQTFVTQSEVPRDILTFELGIVETLRRAPDDLLIGEMRDYETIAAGKLAAQTGMLVYSTMHVNEVATTIPRIISTLKDNGMVHSLLDLMRMICSQDLLHKIGGGRVAVREYLIFTKDICDIIEKELHNPDKIATVINKLVFERGVHFQVHARFLYRNKQISLETFEKFMKGRNFVLTQENLAKLDKRIQELSDINHEMFRFNCEEPIPAVVI